MLPTWVIAIESSQPQSSGPIPNSDYSLPSPGILPSNPFYWAKMVRDRGYLLLSRTPETRYEVLINYADKRFSAGIDLVRKGQLPLAISTLTKAEKYLIQAKTLLPQLSESYQHRYRATVSTHGQLLKRLASQNPDISLEPVMLLNQEAARDLD